MARRKAATTADEETQAADQKTLDEAQADQPDETLAQEQQDESVTGAGVRFYDPDNPDARPGQGHHRDDDLDAAYRREQGRTGPGQAIKRGDDGDTLTDAPRAVQNEHKPAEPTDMQAADQIRGNPFPAAKPAVDALENDLIPGAGDPQNGVLTPPGASPISWATPDPATAQHDENAEDPALVARLRADPYADQPKANPPGDPYAYQRQPQPAEPASTEPPPEPEPV
jgi:hypothetical protein